MLNTYRVRVILEIEAQTMAEAEEKALFAISDGFAYTESMDVIDIEE